MVETHQVCEVDTEIRLKVQYVCIKPGSQSDARASVASRVSG